MWTQAHCENASMSVAKATHSQGRLHGLVLDAPGLVGERIKDNQAIAPGVRYISPATQAFALSQIHDHRRKNRYTGRVHVRR